jgi:hypothetical protein
LAQFGVAAVYVTASGEVGVTSPGEFSLLPVKAAWWVRDRKTARSVVTALGERRPANLDQATTAILAAAKRLDVTLSAHRVVVAQAQAAMAPI